ncbi:hypothetical protein C8F01DRAFT_1351588 [Mycena amicta]|nr:hypothetical protein C8F01DRAFT_1351588 [Mycena amicta]
MSAPRIRHKKLPKPPACDRCKSRRVLCHPQPNGAPCPRCAEQDAECKTTYVKRGRPRKHPGPAHHIVQDLGMVSQSIIQSSSSLSLLNPQIYEGLPNGPELTPQRVAHLFDCFDHLPQVLHPLVKATNIKTVIRTVSFQLHLLPPQMHVLALCIIAYSALISFDEDVLGPGPRPASLGDTAFFHQPAPAVVRSCGTRRVGTCRALHVRALRTAWDSGIMLQPSKENAASCWLLDLLEQHNFSGLSRPWASAYISHIRALAAIWRATNDPVIQNTTDWAGFLMAEAILSTRSRKPILITLEDQLLLSGPESFSLDEFLTSVDSADYSERASDKIVFASMKPFMFHTTVLARTLWQTITGDHTRFAPLSEPDVIQFLSALQRMHLILGHLLEKAELYLTVADPNPTREGDVQLEPPAKRGSAKLTTATSVPAAPGAFKTTPTSNAAAIRGCMYALVVGFVGLALPFEKELALRINFLESTSSESSSTAQRHALARLRTFAAQAHDITRFATHTLACAIRLLPAVHYVPVRFTTLHQYAEFALEDLQMDLYAAGLDNDWSTWDFEAQREKARDLETFTQQLTMAAYSIDLDNHPTTQALIAQMEVYLAQVQAQVFAYSDDIALPVSGLAVALELETEAPVFVWKPAAHS